MESVPSSFESRVSDIEKPPPTDDQPVVAEAWHWLVVNGEVITPDMVRTVENIPELFNAQRGPCDPSGGDQWPRMEPTGIVETRLHLKDGRVLRSYNGRDFE